MPAYFYFDLGNVLCTFCHEQMCRQMAAVAGVPAELVRQEFLEIPRFFAFESGQITEEEFFQEFCERTGTRPDRQALEIATSDIFTLNRAVLPWLSRLADRGHRTGVLSNTNPWHWRWITAGRYAEILPGRFEQFVLSYEVGFLKPTRDIYEAAVQAAGVAAAEVFFVDDRPENVAAALEVGLDAVLFTTTDALADALSERGV